MFGSVVEFIKQGEVVLAFVALLLIGAVIALVTIIKKYLNMRDEEENY